MPEENKPFNMDLHCPWCGENFPDKKTYDDHYRPCFIYNDLSSPSADEVFNLIHNPKHY